MQPSVIPLPAPTECAGVSRFANLLRPEHIVFGVRVADTAGLFDAICALAPLHSVAARHTLARRLARRHARNSTALGGGMALPRAEVTHLAAPMVLYLRLATALPFGAPDGHPVRDVVSLLVRKPAVSADHALLCELTYWLQLPQVRAALAAARTPAEVWQVAAQGACA
jgi:PTS system nitrogen regulatory IIA component